MSTLHSYVIESEDKAFINAKIIFNRYLIESSFIKIIDGNIHPRGSLWDAAYILSRINYENCKVLEVGARDSILGAFLTNKASHVTLIDYFDKWGKGTEYDLGDLDCWTKIWTKAAPDALKLRMEEMNIINMTYPDKSFDIVLAISVLNHMKGQTDDNNGHLAGLQQCARVCTDDGRICISVTMSSITGMASGVYLQDYETLLKWISDCNLEIVADENTQLDKFVPKIHKIYNIKEFYPVCNVLLILKKKQ